MANQTPIPQNPIGESFVWREWFQRLSDRVFGSLSSQDANAVIINGGVIDNTAIGSLTPSTGHFTTLAVNTAIPLTSGGTGAGTASGARTNLGLGTAATHPATDFDVSGAAAAAQAASLQIASNLSDLASASIARTNLGLGTMATENIGISATVALAKITPVGTDGSMTVVNGIVTAYTAPT